MAHTHEEKGGRKFKKKKKKKGVGRRNALTRELESPLGGSPQG